MMDGCDRYRMEREYEDMERAIARDAALDPLTRDICRGLAQISQAAFEAKYGRR